MIPWTLIERTPTPDGKGVLSLHRRGEQWSIRINGGELMNSRMHGSEQRMAELGCAALGLVERPRVLVGGLGMGFTLSACNRCLPADATIDVAELMPAVVAWNRTALGDVAGHPLRDRRVRVQEGDICRLLEHPAAPYDIILLDVDNGPEGLTQASNAWLYGHAGIARTAQALRPGGVLCVWSVKPDSRFTKRLGAAGLHVTEHRTPARAVSRDGRDGRGPTHHIWVATKRKSPHRFMPSATT